MAELNANGKENESSSQNYGSGEAYAQLQNFWNGNGCAVMEHIPEVAR